MDPDTVYAVNLMIGRCLPPGGNEEYPIGHSTELNLDTAMDDVRTWVNDIRPPLNHRDEFFWKNVRDIVELEMVAAMKTMERPSRQP